MPKDETRNTRLSQAERCEYTSLTNSVARTLDLHGGLTDALDVAHYTAMSGSIANLLDLEGGLQEALATMNARTELDHQAYKLWMANRGKVTARQTQVSAWPADPRQGELPLLVSSGGKDTRGAVSSSITQLQAAELVQQAAHGEPAAWQEIMRRYSGLVVAKVRAFRLQDADALDAIQTTWLRLAENLHRIQHPERLGDWLTTTAARECLHIVRHVQRTPTLANAMVDALIEPSASPEDHVINAYTAQTLSMLITELPPRRRRLLRALFTDHPVPYAELSRTTGIPPGSIGPTRTRALRQLRQMLHNHELLPLTEQ